MFSSEPRSFALSIITSFFLKSISFHAVHSKSDCVLEVFVLSLGMTNVLTATENTRTDCYETKEDKIKLLKIRSKNQSEVSQTLQSIVLGER